jgi:glutathione S-transferase
MELGGLKSPEYLKLNPQGKMPLLTVEGSSFAIPESDTICIPESDTICSESTLLHLSITAASCHCTIV